MDEYTAENTMQNFAILVKAASTLSPAHGKAVSDYLMDTVDLGCTCRDCTMATMKATIAIVQEIVVGPCTIAELTDGAAMVVVVDKDDPEIADRATNFSNVTMEDGYFRFR